jgi:hypothetical protein
MADHNLTKGHWAMEPAMCPGPQPRSVRVRGEALPTTVRAAASRSILRRGMSVCSVSSLGNRDERASQPWLARNWIAENAADLARLLDAPERFEYLGLRTQGVV